MDIVVFSASSVPAMIATQTSLRPQRFAVVSAERAVSYAELDRRSSAVARALLAAGLRRNEPVGLCLESSTELIVAALGVWKAGGAYLPIDPAYPAERRAFILSDSGAPLVITRQSLASSVGVGTGPKSWAVICIEDISEEAHAAITLFSLMTEDDLAYIIYTSGSTGQPKGVEITHGNLLNLVTWHTGTFAIGEGDRATQVAGPGFDAAVWEIWPYLSAGATLHIPSPETRLSAQRLRDWMVASEITVSFLPTVLAEEALRLPWPAESSLRLLLTGGDALHVFPPEGLRFPLVNNYGPTECTVVATSGPVNASHPGLAAPAIGSQILNTQVLLLDDSGQEVAEGEPGEIYISGASVGRGYRNRPDLTAERFVHISVGGATMRAFRTGDLAKRLPDGQLAFLGRIDDQVKIRGFRIEPNEIACVLNRHPAIAASAVVARGEGEEKRLVAYVVARPGATVLESDLRDPIGQALPDYMMPASFVLLDRIPVTPNGKLDKNALPAPSETNQLARDAHVAPNTQLEEMVEGIVAPILGVGRVSVDANFFLLGGHSLMGAQVIAKVRDVFGVELNLRDVFKSPTISKLAARIEEALREMLERMSEDEVREALTTESSSGSSFDGPAAQVN